MSSDKGFEKGTNKFCCTHQTSLLIISEETKQLFETEKHLLCREN
jgi:hypothetical protein